MNQANRPELREYVFGINATKEEVIPLGFHIYNNDLEENDELVSL